ncbi:MAG: PAS domain-containing protein [Vicinamibacterales bacterium]
MVHADASPRSRPTAAAVLLRLLAEGPTVAALVGLATVGRLAVDPLLKSQAPFAFYFLAIIVAAWSTSFAVSLVAVGASVVAADFFFVAPRYSLSAPAVSDLSALVVFVIVSTFVAWLISRWRAAERAATLSRDTLQVRTARLEEQARLRQAAEHAALDSQRLLHSTLDNFPTAIAFKDGEGRFLDLNPAVEQALGRSRAEIIGRHLRDFVPAEAAAIVEAHDRVVMDTRQARQSEEVTQQATGTVHHLNTTFPLVDADGRVYGTGHISHDITAVKTVQRALEASERTLKALMDASTESIWLLDRERVLVANTTAAARLGLTVDQLVGLSWRTIFPPEVSALRAEKVEQVFASAAPVRFEDERAGIRFDHSFYPTFGADGNVVAVAAFSRDVTEQRRQEEALRNQALQLEAASRLKDDFLATLSHELRTPINAILGWAQILSMAGQTEDRLRRGLDTIARNARLQATMVEDLLDVSRIVSGGVRLDLQDLDVHAVVDQVLDGARPGADAKGITLTTDIEPGLRITGDSVRLQQVIWNLVTNAIKFTQAGGRVDIHAAREHDQLELTVSDNGIGIAPAFLPHAFERFRQADSSPTREHGGLGLGLAIVRHIVELHGGTVAVHSAGVGHGASFSVRLPMRTIREKGAPSSDPARRADDARPLEALRLFIVDDDRDTREMLATLLSTAGATVQAAGSAAEALAQIPTFGPDVIISDIAMPGGDGYHFIRELRGWDSALARVPSIALTAYGGAGVRDAAIEAGFDRYLPKPVEAEPLIATVARIAEHRPG